MLFDSFEQIIETYKEWFKKNKVDQETFDIMQGMFNNHFGNIKIKKIYQNQISLVNPLDESIDYTMQPYNSDDTTGLLLFEHSQKDKESDIVFCTTKSENTATMVQSIGKTDLGLYFETYSNKKYILNYYDKDAVEYLQSTNGDADSIKPDMKLAIQINPSEYIISMFRRGEQCEYKQINHDFNTSIYSNLLKCKDEMGFDEQINNINKHIK